jgi:glycosyltransferase involved in cell wall biosynthesis
MNTPIRPALGYTANHTICKNEFLLSNGNPSNFIDTWLFYSKDMDYKVILDTGSTDGTWEYLQQCAAKDPSIIIEQKTFVPWNFSEARNYNLAMIPSHVTWAFSADMDEFFSVNTLDVLEQELQRDSTITNLSCARLDIYNDPIIVGQQNRYAPSIGSNKIFRFGDYRWKSRIYEHLSWNKPGYENEYFSDRIFLVHNQDFSKKARGDLYLKMLTEVWEAGPGPDDYSWCMWFLVNHYFKERNFEMTFRTALDYLKADDTDRKKHSEIAGWIQMVLESKPSELTQELQDLANQKLGIGSIQIS